MTFMFDLEVGALTDARGTAVVDDCDTRGAWPVVFVPGRVEDRWFGAIKKSYPPVLEILTTDDRGSILTPDAARDADAIALRTDATPRLADTMRAVAAQFPDGFVFRATWSGSPIQRDVTLGVEALAALIIASDVNEFTRYRVEPS